MVEWKKLGDICEKTSNIKWKDQADDKIYKYIDLSSVSLDSHKVIVTTDVCKQNAPSRAQQIVCANDILLGTTRPTLKRYCQIPSYLDKNICSTGFCIFRANKEYVLSRWLFHNIGSSKFWDYCELKQQGAGYPCLSNSDAFAYMIPIPSIEEQNRIVGILDTFTSSIENLKEQIAQRRKQYEYYRDQLLNLEGKEGVEMKHISDVAKSFTGLTYKPENVSEEGTLVLRSSNINEDVLAFDDNVFVQMVIPDRAIVKENDILICVRNGSKRLVGKAAIITKKAEGMAFGAFMTILRSFGIDSKFLFYVWQSKKVKKQYKGDEAMPIAQITAKDFQRIIIPVPPLSEQQRIVSILDTFESSINNLEQQLAQREKQYEYYRNKLLTFE